jgi:hypothetical protein
MLICGFSVFIHQLPSNSLVTASRSTEICSPV